MRDTVFVTGLPRCGSSWVGEALSDVLTARYVYEPFNPYWAPRLRGRLAHFRYLGPQARPRGIIGHTGERAFAGRQGARQLARACYRGYLSATVRRRGPVLVKDPTACLMTAWIANRFRPRILILYRHPCGFASSLAQLGWDFNIDRLLAQDKLMKRHLAPYESALRASRGDTWLRRGAFWGALHRVFLDQLNRGNDWVIWPYESLCANPDAQFAAIARRLGLPATGSAPETTHARTGARRDTGSTRRPSESMADVWRKRLTPGQVDAVTGAATTLLPRGAFRPWLPAEAHSNAAW